MLGKIDVKKKSRQQITKCLDNVTKSLYLNLKKFWEIVKRSPASYCIRCSKKSDMTD